MFKKLKDKLTEEVKIPSAKFTQSMQQLAQAVVSPSSNNNASFDHASNDNFSIGGDFDDTPQNSPIKNSAGNEGGVAYRGGVATPLGVAKDTGAAAGFTPVDLQQDSTPQKLPPSASSSAGGMGILSDTFNNLRRSSVSSSTSDSSFMFPVLESSGPTYNFQSDLESCSETSESVGPNINKEQLLQAYQKIQQRYQKYKGRYADLARHYRELERENSKAKNILAECQDKALRRMSELKEQCLLEKQAKAHLEEALRSDLEEKDHLIHTLETKIKLLKTSVDQSPLEQTSSTSGISTQGNSETSAEVSPLHSGQEDLLSSGGESTLSASVLAPEPAPAAPSSEAEQAAKEKVKKLEMLLLKCREDITNKCEMIKNLETDKHAANAAVQVLQEQLSAVKKREEEASLSLAKNKLSIHRELEAKEEEIKKLSAQLTSALNRISDLQGDIVQIEEDSKKDLAAGKVEATRLIQAEMQQLVINSKNLEETLASRDKEVATKEAEAAQAWQQLKNIEQELAQLKYNKQQAEEESQQNISLLTTELSHLQELQGSKDTKHVLVAQLRPFSNSLQDLRTASQDMKNSVVNLMEEAQDFTKTSLEKVLSDTLRIYSEKVEEFTKVCLERDALKCESEEAKSTLKDLSVKLSSLDQSLVQEKANISALEQELASTNADKEDAIKELNRIKEENAAEISSLKEQLNQEKETEDDARQKLVDIEHQLSKERDNLCQNISTLEIEVAQLSEKLRTEEHQREQLENQIRLLEERNSNMVEQCNREETRCSELINQVHVLKQSLDQRNDFVSELQASLSELKGSHDDLLSASRVEKQHLENDYEAILAEQRASVEKISNLEMEISDLQGKLERSEEIAAQHSHVLEQISFLEDKVNAMEEKASNLVLENKTLSHQLEEKGILNQEQEALLKDLQGSKEDLQQSLEKIYLELDDKSSQLSELESLSKEMQNKLSESADLSQALIAMESELKAKAGNCEMLEVELQKLQVSLSEQETLLASKTGECLNLNQQLEILCLESTKHKSQVDNLLETQLNQKELLKEKTQECVELELRLGQLKEEQSKEANEIQKSREEDLKLSSKLGSLETDNANLCSTLKSKILELELLTNQLTTLEEKLDHESELVKEKTNDYNNLLPKLDILTAENIRLNEVLKQKYDECEEKEAQLDNLADEMKRVEELSQELHRINDDRDANVEVLSSEASHLAQKVEELTVTTQEMKEREVQLLQKLEVTEVIQKEYLALKNKEKALASELNEVQNLETELRTQLQNKSKFIEDLEEENKRLREAGKNLPELVARAKEAEAQCVQLKQDETNLMSRIQKAEESEIKCAVLEEELMTLRIENARLQTELESAEKIFTPADKVSPRKSMSTSAEVLHGNTMYSKEPVTEEPCIAKHFADLTEGSADNIGEETVTDGEKMWENKYNKLLEEHKRAMLSNSEVIEKLREENLWNAQDSDSKQKQRLWDRQDGEIIFVEEKNNPPLATIERLQQQLTSSTTQLKEMKKQHRQEVEDLRRILLNHGSGNSYSVSRTDNLEDATELEYLRNILFEYMMGKEPLVLARVIAAVVKFDSDQTHKVLQKEQQRLSLLGQLGIS